MTNRNPVVRGLAWLTFWLLLSVMLIWMGIGFFIGRAFAQDAHTHQHMQYHPAYSTWRQPGSDASCCNARVIMPSGDLYGDCYVTKAELRQGKDGPEWWAERALEDGGGWIPIPERKRIREKNPDPTGRSAHLCYNHYTHEVLCFVPPSGGT